MKYLLLTLISLVFFSSCSKRHRSEKRDWVFQDDQIRIEKISDQVYRHVSMLDAGSFGQVECNGMVVVNQGEAVIFDTPTTDSASVALLDWVEHQLGAKATAIIPTHFHEDCLGGLQAFHQAGVPSYASYQTIELARSVQLPVPQFTLEQDCRFPVGEEMVEVTYLGAGHTRDNIVAYVPADSVLFGGCLIKEEGADKGNLADADVQQWPHTIERVQQRFSDVRLVIPGHGAPGDSSLLSYTSSLF